MARALRSFRRRPLLATALVIVVATGLMYGARLEHSPAAGIVGVADGLRRSSRDVYTFTVNSIDYKYSMRNYDQKTEEYYEVLSEVHLRAAKRILKLCEAKRGFYTKAGHFIASLQQFPREYANTLIVLQDQVQYPGLQRQFEIQWPFFQNVLLGTFVYPLVVAAHPSERYQFALGLNDGGVEVLEMENGDPF